MDNNKNLMLQEESRFRIVIAAPETDERYRLKAILEREESTVVEFDGATSLLEHLQTLSQPEETQFISMIIVQWSLSDPTLKQLVRHLQQVPFSTIPLIALTSSPCVEINEAMMFLKHKDVLEQPIKSNDLLAVLNKFLLQPTGTPLVVDVEKDYYTLLESNSLLELAIKNHKNAYSPNTAHEATSEDYSAIPENLN